MTDQLKSDEHCPSTDDPKSDNYCKNIETTDEERCDERCKNISTNAEPDKAITTFLKSLDKISADPRAQCYKTFLVCHLNLAVIG
jgi:hypothetical protein